MQALVQSSHIYSILTNRCETESFLVNKGQIRFVVRSSGSYLKTKYPTSNRKVYQQEVLDTYSSEFLRPALSCQVLKRTIARYHKRKQLLRNWCVVKLHTEDVRSSDVNILASPKSPGSSNMNYYQISVRTCNFDSIYIHGGDGGRVHLPRRISRFLVKNMFEHWTNHMISMVSKELNIFALTWYRFLVKNMFERQTLGTKVYI